MNFYIKLLKHCNLRCNYCFEQEYFKDPRILSLHDMIIMLNRIKVYALAKKLKQITLIFTGGEVLTLGESYLQSLFGLCVKVFKKSRIKLNLGVQTNLTLMNAKYIRLFKKYRIILGVSFDVYGGQRKFKNGEPADPIIINKMIMLIKAGLYFGAITVISRSNYKKGKEIYDLFKTIYRGFHTLRLDPCSEELCPDQMISPMEYVKTLIDIGERHIEQKEPKIPVASVDSYIELLRKGAGNGRMCLFSRQCLKSNIFIENNGDVYPCCSLRQKDLFLGNMFENSLDEILNSPILRRLNKRYEFIKKECRGCRYLKICSGGCMADAYSEGNILGRSKSWCVINRALFKYVGSKLKKQGEQLAIRI